MDIKDIGKYSVEALTKALDKVGKSIKETKESGAPLIGEVDGAKIYFLNEFEAAKKYMAGTKWCITDKSTFEEYCEENNIFAFIKNDKKFCLLVCINDGEPYVSISSDSEKYVAFNDDDSYIDKGLFAEDDDCLPISGKLSIPEPLVKFFDLSLIEVKYDFTKMVNICLNFSKKNKNYHYIFANGDFNLDDLNKLSQADLNEALNAINDNADVMESLQDLFDSRSKYADLYKKVMASPYRENLESIKEKYYQKLYAKNQKLIAEILESDDDKNQVKKIQDLIKKNKELKTKIKIPARLPAKVSKVK